MKNIRIRLADEDDCRDIYDWRTDPVTMKMCFSTGKISYESHVRWFNQSLKNPARKIFIALDEDGNKIGQVRFDDIDGGPDDSAEVGIVVSPSFRGKGIGTSLLVEGCRHYLNNYEKDTIIAKIRDENIASTKIFTRAGFEKVRDIDNGIQMELKRK